MQKQRNYMLGGKNPPRSAFQDAAEEILGVKFVDVTPKEEPTDDDIPTHRTFGDQVTFPYADKMWTGEVVAVKDVLTCLIKADDEMFYERGQQITHLPESARCSHCGQFGFLCNSECPAKARKPRKQTDKTMSKQKTIDIYQVLEIEPGTDDKPAWVNDTVECVVTNVKEAKGKGPVKATLCKTSDKSVKITGIFWKRDFEDIEKLDGKLVSMEGGMIRSEYKPDKGPRIQQLAVQAKCVINIIGEAADSKGGMPPERSEPPDNGRNASDRPRTPANGTVVTARKAIFEKFRLLGLVHTAYASMKEDYNLPEMDGAALSTFSTGVGISLARGESLPEHMFDDVKKPSGMSTKELDKQPDHSWEGDPPQSTEKTEKQDLTSWKSCPHPRRKNSDGEPLTIGEMTQADRLKYCMWAATSDQPEEKADKLFYANIKMLMASKGWSEPTKLLALSIAENPDYGSAFSDDNVNQYTQDKFKKDVDDLDSEEALLVCGEFEDAIKEIMEFASKPKKKSTTKSKPSMPD